MYDIINNWPELEILKQYKDLSIDKFYNNDTNKFEVNIKAKSDEEDEWFNATIEFVINEKLERGSCYCYVMTFDARNTREIWDGQEFLNIIAKKCRDFDIWLQKNNYTPETGRCFPKMKKND